MQAALVAIIGPTASGKTSLAIYLGRKTQGAVISADSRQVYAGFNIGTAKPPEAWREEPHVISVPDVVENVDHYAVNIVSPTEAYSLASWQTAAFEIIDRLHTESVPPYLVGGTMLYIDSILDNFVVPQVPPNQQLRDQLAARPTTELYKELLAQDPAARQFVEPHHARRIIRALEVIKATNKPFSDLRKKRPARYRTLLVGLFPGWHTLEENVRERGRTMLANGLVEEVQQLRTRYGVGLPLLSTMNYREAGALLDGHLTAPEALEALVRTNMRYARRQMAWWKHRSDVTWYGPADREVITQAVTEFLSAKDR